MSHRAIVFRAECKPEFRADFIARAQRHAAVVRSEPGCIRCDVLVPVDDGNVIFLYDLFDDEAALKAHSEMPYMPGWREDIAPMVITRDATFTIVTND